MSLGAGLGAINSDALADDQTVYTGAALLWGAVLTAGADVATLILYDNTAKSGVKLIQLSAVANTTARVTLAQPILVTTGIEAAITGTAPFAFAYYNPR